VSLTRANLENELINGYSLGFWLVEVGLDGTTVSGSNSSLNTPIRDAMNVAGFATVDPINVADADVAMLTDPDSLRQVLDIANYRVLQKVMQCWGRAEERIVISPAAQYSGLSEQTRVLLFERKSKRLRTQIDETLARIDRLYNFSSPPLEGGSIGLGMIQDTVDPNGNPY